MMKAFTFVAAAMLLAATPALGKFQSGIPWGTDNHWARKIPDDSISWYHHWQEGKVHQMPKDVEYVPTFWGPSKYAAWEARKIELALDKKIQNILAFNEPDVPSQASMSPDEAVSLFMKELQPYAEKGYRVSSPQMVFDMDWLNQFMDKCESAGCKISFMALHWYGAPSDMDKFTSWVDRVHNKFQKPIWVTEYGLTSESNPSPKEVTNFIKSTASWIASKPYVERAAWNGGYDIASPPDGYATPLNAFFVSNGQDFRPTANYWLHALPYTGLITTPSELESEKNSTHSHHKGHGKRGGFEKRRLLK